MLAELFKRQIHVAEEFILFLLVIFEVIEAAACAEQNALAAKRPQCFFHKIEIVDEKLAAVDRDAGQPMAGAEVADGKFASRAFVAEEGEQACAVVVGNVERIKYLTVGDEGIEFAGAGERCEETIVRLIDPLRVHAEEKIDQPLVGRNRRGKRHGAVDMQIDDGLQGFQRERHLTVGRRHGKPGSVIDAGSGLDRRSRGGAVLVDDLEDRRVIGLCRGQNGTRKAEEREVIHPELFAQRMQRQRRCGWVGGAGPAAHIGQHLLQRERFFLFRRGFCSCLREVGKKLHELGVFFQGGKILGVLLRKRLGGRFLFGTDGEIGQVLLAQTVCRIDIRIQDVAEASVLPRKQIHQIPDVGGELPVDAGKEIVGVLAVGFKRQSACFGGKDGGKVHFDSPSEFGA